MAHTDGFVVQAASPMRVAPSGTTAPSPLPAYLAAPISTVQGQQDQRFIAAVLLALWGFNYYFAWGLTTATVVSVLTMPLWITAVSRYRLARPIMALGCLALLGGVLLALFYSSKREYDLLVGLEQSLLVVGIVGGIGLILWARTRLSTGVIAVVLGCAMLLGELDKIGASSNPWKYEVSAPVTLILLGLLWRYSFVLQAAAALGLAVVGLAFDSRSYSSLCFAAAILVMVQHLPYRPAKGWRGPVTLLAAGVVGVLVFYGVSTQLALNGTLGNEVAARTQEQVQRAGSLLVGGRPEWTGTTGLMHKQPSGFGFGAVPDYEDVWAARVGLDAAGINTSNGYVDRYMFAGQFKLHSVTADMWAQAGLFGLLFAGMAGVATFLSLVERWRAVTMTALTGFLAAKALWDLSFSPIYSSALWLAVSLGLVLVMRSGTASEARVSRS